MADTPFKKDIVKGREAETLLQLVEDTEFYASNNLKIVFQKQRLYKIQLALVFITLVLMLRNWINI